MRRTVITLEGELTREQLLAAIKQLRDHANDVDADVNWPLGPCLFRLDQASDALEFLS